MEGEGLRVRGLAGSDGGGGGGGGGGAASLVTTVSTTQEDAEEAPMQDLRSRTAIQQYRGWLKGRGGYDEQREKRAEGMKKTQGAGE
jgi:hypothetical protein